MMDGNGRWAELRGLPRIEGHRRGAERSREIIDSAIELDIRCLTLYAFSTENWQRPKEEVSMLMKILEFYLNNEFEALIKKDVVFRAIGETWRLPDNIQDLIRETEYKTKNNKGLNLVAALSYSGRSEIIRAVRKVMNACINPTELTEEDFDAYLDTAGLPQPDLIIRTSGERRLSNFLLWQAAYAELYFSDTLWPDFDREEFMLAIQDFQGRERRFGKISGRVNAS
ncbi:MAG: polyprenyl diphosphate synthase [Nitrospirota bacterium]|nr:polyprenyl diphosphate synthase [Nitrospirota bacterium]